MVPSNVELLSVEIWAMFMPVGAVYNSWIEELACFTTHLVLM